MDNAIYILEFKVNPKDGTDALGSRAFVSTSEAEASVPSLNTSITQHLKTSKPQNLNTSIPQYLSHSVS
jgi:hypothetical protein